MSLNSTHDEMHAHTQPKEKILLRYVLNNELKAMPMPLASSVHRNINSHH